jgi:ribosomal protein S18 acetylase RimI-like enzyme
MPLFAAAPSDLEAVAALVNGAYRGHGGARGWTHEADYIDGPRTSAEALRADLAAQAAQREGGLFVWRDAAGAEALGCVWLEPADADAWYLGMLSVRPDLQDRQLGRAILQAAEAWTAERGARRVRMTVINTRDTLIAWYERRGYVRTGETQPFPYGDDRFGKPSREDLCFVVLEKAVRPLRSDD